MPTVPEAVLINYPESSLIEIKQNFTCYPKSGGGKRGAIKGFSRASRVRMMNLLNRIERSAYAHSKLITLTYHKNQRDHNESKNHLNRFNTYIRRNHPDHAGIWKLEYQDRGSIHFHVLTFGRFIHHKEIADTWTRIAEPGNHIHNETGTEIRATHKARNIVAYISKYLSKPINVQGPSGEQPTQTGRGTDLQRVDSIYTGRFWGVINRSGLPLGRPVSLVLEGTHASRAQRYLRGRYNLGDHSKSSVCIYSRNAGDHAEIIDRIMEFKDEGIEADKS